MFYSKKGVFLNTSKVRLQKDVFLVSVFVDIRRARGQCTFLSGMSFHLVKNFKNDSGSECFDGSI